MHTKRSLLALITILSLKLRFNILVKVVIKGLEVRDAKVTLFNQRKLSSKAISKIQDLRQVNNNHGANKRNKEFLVQHVKILEQLLINKNRDSKVGQNNMLSIIWWQILTKMIGQRLLNSLKDSCKLVTCQMRMRTRQCAILKIISTSLTIYQQSF